MSDYNTAHAYESGCSFEYIAKTYFDDFTDIYFASVPQLPEISLLPSAQIQAIRKRYRMLVDCFLNDGDVTLHELRGYIDGVSIAIGVPLCEFEWLHDSFEWVIKKHQESAK